MEEEAHNKPSGEIIRHARRPRYSGKYPRRYEQKYKERQADLHPDTVAKVIAGGKTPAGTHRPIMVGEILEALSPKPGEIAVDCTLGYGGHAEQLLRRVLPGGKLIGIDADPIQLPKTTARLHALGYGPEVLTTVRTNYAGLPKVLFELGVPQFNLLLADLGVSSMQIDDPQRGFSVKFDGPLDMRMNPHKGVPASTLIEKADVQRMVRILTENADEPYAELLARELAGRQYTSTAELARRIRVVLGEGKSRDSEESVRRVFQALRIAVNDEFGTLERLLTLIPGFLAPGGRVAILTFHSGEDRRVKSFFEDGLRSGAYAEISPEPIRPGKEERYANPRSASAKLRVAVRSAE